MRILESRKLQAGLGLLTACAVLLIQGCARSHYRVDADEEAYDTIAAFERT